MLLFGDFSRFTIADHTRGTLVDFVPVVFAEAANRPDGTRGMLFTWRVGSDTVDPDSARVLLL